MARFNPFRQVEHVLGVTCEDCGMVYDKVTNRTSEYCECGAHIVRKNPNSRTYLCTEHASDCMIKRTTYLFGAITTLEFEYDVEFVPTKGVTV